MDVCKRLQLHGPQLDRDDVPWWKVWGGHGGDEYGNCTFFLQTVFLGGFTLWTDRHLQFEIETPYMEDGESIAAWRAWYDRKYRTGTEQDD